VTMPAINLRIVALLAALTPFLAVHLTYLIAASHGFVDWCIPYIDSCTSISATGRKPPASYVFRALMLPSAIIMMAYWWLNHSWLQSLHRRAGFDSRIAAHWMLALGIVACIGLILYVTVLGESGKVWASQRRVGTVLFFSFTFIAQLLMVYQLRQLQSLLPQVPKWLPQTMLMVCQLLLALGLLTVALDAWDEDWYDTLEDAFEWVLSLLLQSNFMLGYFVWRYAGWTLRIDNP